MAVSITDRLTAAIRIAEQSIAQAQYQADYRNWHEVHRVLQDARDALQRPPSVKALTPELQHILDTQTMPVTIEKRIDGRTKEARALKAGQ